MERQEAIKELKAYQNDNTKVLSNDVIDVALKALSDKKARYWKRRWLKQRDNIYYVISVLKDTGHPTTAEFIKSMIIEEKRDEMGSSNN